MPTQNPFGIHVMDYGVDENAMWKYLEEAQPALTVVLNNHSRAQAIKAKYPWMIVVHRQYHINDSGWHTSGITPRQWVDQHRVFGQNGVVVQCFNEPGGDFRNNAEYRKRYIDYMVGVWQQADYAIVGNNFSVGNPHEEAVENGSFDDLIYEAATNGRAYWAVHEYWHTNPVAEAPWLAGRNVFAMDRALELGLPPLRILITEHGMDKGGGFGDGWRNQGVGAAQYAQQFIASRSVQPYRPPTALYGFGTGFGWAMFDVNDEALLNALKGYRENAWGQEMEWIEGRLVSVEGSLTTPVNIRTAPAVSTSTYTGAKLYPSAANPVYYREQVYYGSGYDWYPVWWNDSEHYVAVLNRNVNPTRKIAQFARATPDTYVWSPPVDMRYHAISGRFGEPRSYGEHEGVDLAPLEVRPESVFVYAMADGVVERVRRLDEWMADRAAGRPANYGCYVRIKVGLYTVWLCHLSLPMVQAGDVVKRGDVVGVIGDTGNSVGAFWDGMHLHVTIQKEGEGRPMGGLTNIIDPALLVKELG